MKRILFAIIIFNLSIGYAFSQQFHGGVMAGLVGSQVAGDSFSGFKKAGIYAGGFVSLDVGGESSLRMELSYFQKGSRENPTEKNGYRSYLLRLNYIELPILYQYQVGKFNFFGGPSAGFLLGYNESVDQEVISDHQNYNKPARVTLQVNFGFRFGITPEISVDFRTNNSLMNVFSENQTGDVLRVLGQQLLFV